MATRTHNPEEDTPLQFLEDTVDGILAAVVTYLAAAVGALWALLKSLCGRRG